MLFLHATELVILFPPIIYVFSLRMEKSKMNATSRKRPNKQGDPKLAKITQRFSDHSLPHPRKERKKKYSDNQISVLFSSEIFLFSPGGKWKPRRAFFFLPFLRNRGSRNNDGGVRKGNTGSGFVYFSVFPARVLCDRRERNTASGFMTNVLLVGW